MFPWRRSPRSATLHTSGGSWVNCHCGYALSANEHCRSRRHPVARALQCNRRRHAHVRHGSFDATRLWSSSCGCDRYSGLVRGRCLCARASSRLLSHSLCRSEGRQLPGGVRSHPSPLPHAPHFSAYTRVHDRFLLPLPPAGGDLDSGRHSHLVSIFVARSRRATSVSSPGSSLRNIPDDVLSSSRSPGSWRLPVYSVLTSQFS